MKYLSMLVERQHILLELLKRYISVGFLNTAIHFSVFYGLLFFEFPQSISNMFAFYTAASFSFVCNAKFTFKAEISLYRYVGYLVTFGVISFSVGYVGDMFNFHALVTLISFSIISFILGFLVSNYVILKK